VAQPSPSGRLGQAAHYDQNVDSSLSNQTVERRDTMMRLRNRLGYRLLTASLLVPLVLVGTMKVAPSQTSEAGSAQQAIHANQLIHVKTCDPKLNINTSGGYAPGPYYGAYAPGWGYRGGYWGDPYGYRYYQEPVTTTLPQLGIDYVNVSPKTMSEIDFGLVVNGVLRAEVKDAGTFSPGVEIKHKFGISENVFPIQSALPQCIPLRITFENGKHWTNPGLPPKNTKLYAPNSSEIHMNP
jgi:hypothetical protein